MVHVQSSGKSQEYVEEVSSDRMEVSNTSNNDGGPVDDNPPLIGFNRHIMTVEKMIELGLRYEVPLGYAYMVPNTNEYVSTLGPLEISVSEESFRARFRIPILPFIKELFNIYGLVPIQIHPNYGWLFIILW